MLLQYVLNSTDKDTKFMLVWYVIQGISNGRTGQVRILTLFFVLVLFCNFCMISIWYHIKFSVCQLHKTSRPICITIAWVIVTNLVIVIFSCWLKSELLLISLSQNNMLNLTRKWEGSASGGFRLRPWRHMPPKSCPGPQIFNWFYSNFA